MPVGTSTPFESRRRRRPSAVPGSGHRSWRPAAAGTAFHRLAAVGGPRRWPAAVAAAVLAVLAFYGLLTLSVSVQDQMPTAGVPLLRAQTNTAVHYAAIAAITVVVLLLVRFVEGRPAATIWSVLGRIRWRLLAGCLAAALVLGLLRMVGLRPWAADGWVGWTTAVGGAAAITVFVVFQAAGEEVLFRGLLLQTAGRIMSNPAPAIVVQALVWVWFHQPSGPFGFAAVLTTGILLGILTRATGGLEAAIAWHIIHNTVGDWLTAATRQPGQVSTEANAGDMAPDRLIPHLVVVTGTITVVYLAAFLQRAATRVPESTLQQREDPDDKPTRRAVEVMADAERW